MGKLSVKKGDTVMVIAGRKGKEGIRGKTGKVLMADPNNSMVIVEGLRVQRRHMKPRNANEAGIIEKEGPIHASNVMVVCPKCGKPTRVGHTVDEKGNKVRVCTRKTDGTPCGGVLDKGAKVEKKKGETEKKTKKAEGEKKAPKKTTRAKKTEAEKIEDKVEAETAEAQEAAEGRDA